jgi:hypothetical protein
VCNSAHDPVLSAVLLDDAHRYWLDGRELDGCTTTLKAVGLIDTAHYTEEARQRGSYVHEMIEMDLEGDLAEESVDPALFGYLLAARAYLHESAIEILATERALADPVRGIAGKPDLFGRRRVQHVLVDWKTGGREYWHQIQTSWYEHLGRVNGLVFGLCDRETVYLRDDGTYTRQVSTDRQDWQIAQAAILIMQARRAHGSR